MNQAQALLKGAAGNSAHNITHLEIPKAEEARCQSLPGLPPPASVNTPGHTRSRAFRRRCPGGQRIPPGRPVALRNFIPSLRGVGKSVRGGGLEGGPNCPDPDFLQLP